MMTVMAVAAIAVCGGVQCELPDESAGTELDYSAMSGFVLEDGDGLLAKYAPIILVEGYDKPYNRVGTPTARFDKQGEEEIFVDPAVPTYYTQIQEWKSETASYTNLIYRVHFERSKSNRKSADGGSGRNVGAIVVVTLNEENKPVFVNSVQTCGCFHAILPTTFTPASAYPDGWDTERYSVYGETLPGMMHYPEQFDAGIRPVMFLRDGNHRTADLLVASITSVRAKYQLVPAKYAPMEALKHLPLGDGETSFYYESGKNQGLVKGAYKRKEAILLGAWTGDGRIGQDRIYADDEELPRGFYTSIKRKEKDDSNMWDYAAFLELNGWKP